eukprot:7380851-Prymnesium_polylepis.1
MGSHELRAAPGIHGAHAVQLAAGRLARVIGAHGTLGQKVHRASHVPYQVDGYVEREELASEAGGVHEAALGAGVEDRDHGMVVHGRRCGHASPMVNGLSQWHF